MTTPAGWHDDGQGSLRYWDGSAWTMNVVQSESPALPPAASAFPPAVPAPYSAPPAVYAAPQPPMPIHPAYQSYPAYGSALMPAATAPVRPVNGLGIAGFVVGLVAVFLPLLFGVVGGLTGLGLSIGGMARPGRAKGLAIAGLVLSILAVILIF